MNETELQQLSAFGGDDKNGRHLNNATIYFKTDNGQKLPIKVRIVPNKATPLQNNARLIDTKFRYLRGLEKKFEYRYLEERTSTGI